MLHAFRGPVGKYVTIGILGFIAITFVFFGLDFSVTQSPFAAKVNGTDIPMFDFEQELQSYQTQYQETFRVELTDDLRREIRRTVVDQMVMREALRQQADETGYYVSNARLAESIRSTPAFQVGGEFSVDTYQALLRANNLTPAMYEAQQREALSLLEFQDGIAASTFLTPAEYRSYIELTNQRRQVAYALFETSAFTDGTEVDEAAIAEYHAANQSLYMTPETVDIEYVELELASIAATIDITEDDLRAYYDEIRDEFETEEERRVSHILIAPEGDDYVEAEAEVAAALERLNAGEDFATVAAEVSDDGGTSQLGGDLGWIARGIMAGPFEDALYAMELGAIEGPVETEFGYHILRLDEIRRGQVQTFEAVREELGTRLSTEQANSVFYDRANLLRQAAFDAYDELASVAEEMDLTLETVEGFGRGGDPERFPNGGEIVDRVFSEEAIISGRNSDLIELNEDHVVIVRVAEHHEPEPEPLEAVADRIREQLALQSAQTLAGNAAGELVAALEALPPESLEAFAADPAAAATSAQEAAEASPDEEAEASAAESTEASAEVPADSPSAESPDASVAATTDGQPVADPQTLAEGLGGTWNAAAWVGRADPNVPAEVLATVFAEPAANIDGPVVRRVPLRGGGEAVFVLTGVRPGEPEAIAVEERDQRLELLADQTAQIEIAGYAGNVRDEATVRVPDEVLDPQF